MYSAGVWTTKRRSLTTLQSIDTLGQSKTMKAQRYAWLIGMTDAPDSRLLEWAHSFKNPPSLEVKGARLEPEGAYVSERRAIRLVIESRDVTIVLKPTVRCVNPVFELRAAPKTLRSAMLGDRLLGPRNTPGMVVLFGSVRMWTPSHR